MKDILEAKSRCVEFFFKHVKINKGSIQKVSQNKIMQTISMLQNQKSGSKNTNTWLKRLNMLTELS